MQQLSIKNLRKQAHRTQKEMAELCDVSLTTYTKWEKNPADMPHGLYLQVIDFLEHAVQIRKETTMAHDMGMAHVVCLTPEEAEREAAENPYTVPIPEGLEEDFHPSKPITFQQMVDWETNHKEPYPGYADEYEAWESAWQEVELAQMKADGVTETEINPVHVDPEFDPATGEPIIYDEPHIVQDDQSGEGDLFLDEADLTEDELQADANTKVDK